MEVRVISFNTCKHDVHTAARNSGLTFVPPSIVELNSLGVISQPAPRTFKRVQTAPPCSLLVPTSPILCAARCARPDMIRGPHDLSGKQRNQGSSSRVFQVE